MLSFFMTVIMISFICLALTLLPVMISKKGEVSKHKASPFECGLKPKKDNNFLFSSQFFIVTLVFLIFDMELLLLYPLFTKGASVLSITGVSFVLFIWFLLGGLVLEWSQKSLEWNK